MENLGLPAAPAAARDVGPPEAPPRPSVIAAARAFARRGWAPLPLEPGQKRPRVEKGWPSFRVAPGDVSFAFHAKDNLGVILGDASGGLVDVDLDCPEALTLAPLLLPPTPALFGRPGAPRAHWLYLAPGAVMKRYVDKSEAETKTLIELRSTGGQTMAPPSVHPSGEVVAWEPGAESAEPAPIPAPELSEAVRKVALAALLVRHGIPQAEAVACVRGGAVPSAIYDGSARGKLAIEWGGFARAPVSMPPRKPVRPVRVDEDGAAELERAVAAYNEAHPLTLPKDSSPCPICGDTRSYGTLPKSNGQRWSCFSSDHPSEGPGAGVPMEDEQGRHGDALDLAVHAAGLRGANARAELLRAEGLLPPRRSRRPSGAGGARSTRPPEPTKGPARPAGGTWAFVAADGTETPLERAKPTKTRSPARLREPGDDDGDDLPEEEVDALERRMEAQPEEEPPPLPDEWTPPTVGEVTGEEFEAQARGLRWPGGSPRVPVSAYYIDRGSIRREYKEGSQLVSPAPIYVAARARDVAGGDVSLLLRWKSGPTWVELWAPRGQVFVSSELRKLAARDLPVSSETAGEMVRWLSAFESANRGRLPEQRVSSALGWVHGEHPEDGFLLGSELLTPSADKPEEVRFTPAGAGERKLALDCKARGTLEAWRDLVAPIFIGGADGRGFPLARAMVYASLAAPLLAPMQSKGFVVDLAGRSSRGKTTSLGVGASVWGRPEGLIGTWDTTRIGIEQRLAASGGGLPVFIDETMRGQPKIIEEVVFAVANGQGRTRGEAAGGTRATAEWRTVAGSTGNVRLIDYCQGEGSRARVVQLWGSPFGEGNEAELVQRLNRELAFTYGVAGRAWIEKLHTLDMEALRDVYRETWRNHAALVPPGDGAGVGSRLAQYTAILDVAAATAHAAGVVPGVFAPMPWGEVLGAASAEAAPETRAWTLLASWIAGHRSEFVDGQQSDRTPPSAGFAGVWRPAEGYVGFLAARLNAALVELGFEQPEAVLRAAQDRGWLLPGYVGAGKRLAQVRCEALGKPYVVRLTTTSLGIDAPAHPTRPLSYEKARA